MRIAARIDQVTFKLYVVGDQGPRSKHFRDLKRLTPDAEELMAAARWCRTHDPSGPFQDMLRQALAHLGVQDADV